MRRTRITRLTSEEMGRIPPMLKSHMTKLIYISPNLSFNCSLSNKLEKFIASRPVIEIYLRGFKKLWKF